jgi:hypothetical protein
MICPLSPGMIMMGVKNYSVGAAGAGVSAAGAGTGVSHCQSGELLHHPSVGSRLRAVGPSEHA